MHGTDIQTVWRRKKRKQGQVRAENGTQHGVVLDVVARLLFIILNVAQYVFSVSSFGLTCRDKW